MNIESYVDKYNEITKMLFVDMIENGEGKNIIMSPLFRSSIFFGSFQMYYS